MYILTVFIEPIVLEDFKSYVGDHHVYSLYVYIINIKKNYI